MYDRCIIRVKGGKGGDGCISYRSIGCKNGRPNGGNGGNGGSIYIEADENYHDLSHLRTHYSGSRGAKGGTEFKTGRSGKNIILYVPVGTIVSYNNKINELNNHKQKCIIAQGTTGGIGNGALVSQICHNPSYSIPPQTPSTILVRLQLKLIGDIGLIGPPNVGKSSLINKLCNSKYKTGNYNFTTLYAQKGRCMSKTIVDLPGLIVNASKGRGLGTQFLQHIERVPQLYLVVSSEAPLEQAQMIFNEISPEIVSKIKGIIINKSDLIKNRPLAHLESQLKNKYKLPILLLSVKFDQGFEKLTSII